MIKSALLLNDWQYKSTLFEAMDSSIDAQLMEKSN